ncbi:hypothetical protein HKX48_008577 [Thoreauomyces humboldtii]|nr:hypothetical protein HKX48_008577 [Thoreauomyces humboldtii]
MSAATESHLATPPQTPPTCRRASLAASAAPPRRRPSSARSQSTSNQSLSLRDVPPLSVTQLPPLSPPRTRSLPRELWAQIISHLASPADIFPVLTVSRTWHAFAERQLYRSITFTSLAQRNRFAARLCSDRHLDLAIEMRWMTAQEVAVRRATWSAVPVGTPPRKLVRSIDFGFKPSVTTPAPPSNPTPTPVSSSATTPTGSPVIRPTSASALGLPNSIALAAAHLNSGPSSSSYGNLPDVHAYGAWPHRAVSPLIVLIAHHLPDIVHLNLAGCQFDDGVFAENVPRFTNLRTLDVSCTNIRNMGLAAIASSFPGLIILDLSGTFRLRRNRSSHLANIVQGCQSLQRISVLQCSDVAEAVVEVRETTRDRRPDLVIEWSGFDPVDAAVESVVASFVAGAVATAVNAVAG